VIINSGLLFTTNSQTSPFFYSTGRNVFLLPFVGGLLLHIPFVSIFCVQISVAVLYIFYLLVQNTILLEDAINNEQWIFLGSFLFENVVAVCADFIFLKYHRVYFAENLWYRFTENRALREESHIRQEILRQKGQYIAQVAHDIGTPLTTFTLVIELLKEHVHTEECMDILETALTAIEQMTVTRLEALDHAKHMEGLELRPTVKQVNIRDVLRKCARIMSGYAGVCDIPHDFYVDPAMPKLLLTDYEWIWTMIINYLSNAKKYSSKGRIVTTVMLVPGQAFFRVVVDDEGIGVPDDRKNMLFQAFGQLQSGAGGIGLGLHGVSVKAQALGGRVGVRDNPFAISGSSFCIELPLTSLSDMDTDGLPPKLKSILLIGEWSRFPSESQLLSFLQARYQSVISIDYVEQVQQLTFSQRRGFSAVLWILDDVVQSATKKELLVLFSMAKQQLAASKTRQQKEPKVLVIPPWTQILWSSQSKPKNEKGWKFARSNLPANTSASNSKGSRAKPGTSIFLNAIQSPKSIGSSPAGVNIFSPSSDQHLPQRPKAEGFFTTTISPRRTSGNFQSMSEFPASRAITMPTFRTAGEDEMGEWMDQDSEKHSDEEVDRMSLRIKTNLTRSRLRGRYSTAASHDSGNFGSISGALFAIPQSSLKSSLSFTIDSFKIPSASTTPAARKTGLHMRLTSEVSDKHSLSSFRDGNSKCSGFGVLEIALQEAAHASGFQVALRQMHLDNLTAFVIQTQAVSVNDADASNFFTLTNYMPKTTNPSNQEEAGQQRASRSRAATAQNFDILVVDDDPSILKFLHKIFQKNEYSVRLENNGYDGLEALKCQSYKVAFIDRNMPVMDGLECIRRYRKWEKANDRKLKTRQFLVMFSANAHDVDIKESLDIGADKFLPKPVTIQVLLECVHGAEQTVANSRKQSSRGLAAVYAAEFLPTPHLREPSGEPLVRTPRLREPTGEEEVKQHTRKLQPIEDLSCSVEALQEMFTDSKLTTAKEVLVVDDDISTLKLMKRMLEKHKFVVKTCFNGQQALELLKKHDGLDAALIDMNMPIMGGKQCVNEFREWEKLQILNGVRKHRLGIIILSGSDREETSSVLADMVLSKPVQIEELIQAITAVLENDNLPLQI